MKLEFLAFFSVHWLSFRMTIEHTNCYALDIDKNMSMHLFAINEKATDI